MRYFISTFIFILYFSPYVFAQEKVNTYAVVIGVGKYRSIKSLSYTKDDAYMYYAHLKSVEGGSLPEENIKLLIDENATKNNILTSIRKMFDKAGNGDQVILYYSGHGAKGAFVPYDFDGSSNLLYHIEVSKLFENCKAKYKICIADACHSGSFDKDKSVKESLDLYYTNLKQSSGGYILLMSSSSEETSIEAANKRQGIFSYFLIRGLRGYANQNNDKIVTINELYTYVKKAVSEYTANEQNPMIFGNYDLNMPMSVIYSKIESNSDDVTTSVTPTSESTSTGEAGVALEELSTISIAVNEIKENTQVFVDGKYVGKITSLFPIDHPGCNVDGTINVKVKPGKHVIKFMSSDKELVNQEYVVIKNECLQAYFKFTFKTQHNNSYPYGRGNGKIGICTNSQYGVDVWVDDAYIGRTKYYIDISEEVTCGSKVLVSAITNEGWHNIRVKYLDNDGESNFRELVERDKCVIVKLRSQ